MSWKPELQDQSGKWSSNSLRFETEEEAKRSAYNIFCNWYACEDYRATPSEDAVTHKYENGSTTPV